jgi:hypothetical protein
MERERTKIPTRCTDHVMIDTPRVVTIQINIKEKARPEDRATSRFERLLSGRFVVAHLWDDIASTAAWVFHIPTVTGDDMPM